jgi:hypothetical protein
MVSGTNAPGARSGSGADFARRGELGLLLNMACSSALSLSLVA